MSAAALDEAFRGYAIVKASRMRITVHAVAVEDRAPFHAAMRSTLRAAGSYDVRFAAAAPAADVGLDAARPRRPQSGARRQSDDKRCTALAVTDVVFLFP